MCDNPDVDHETVAELYEREARSLLVFFARRTFDGQLAVDLVAETFARAYAGRARVRGDDASRWLWGIARNVLHDAHRTRAAETRALRRLGLERVELTDEEVERIEDLAGLDPLRDALAAALDQLSAEQRDVLRLRVVHELDYRDVAARLGVSEQTARARVSRGLRTLGGALDAAEGVG